MTELQLYQQLLGLSAPWGVQAVEVHPDVCQVRVYVECDPRTSWTCPVCDQPCSGYDQRDERRWRHLDSCGFETWLVARVPRVECKQHGVKTVNVPWAGPFSRFTQAFACFAVAVLKATQQQTQASALLHTTPDELAYLMEQVVQAGIARRQEDAQQGNEPLLETISLDEKQYGRGQRYVTVLSDPAGKRVWEVAGDRNLETVKSLLQASLTARQREAVRAVSMDAWQGFTGAVRAVLPEALQVYDSFHAVQEITHALDVVRREEHARLRLGAKPRRGRKHGQSVLTGTRWWWLRAAETLEPERQATLESLRRAGLETARVWECKEAFRRFFRLPDVEAGRAFLKKWAEEAREIGNARVNAVVKQFEKHETDLLNYLKTGVTNSFAEYVNGRIQTLRERGRGFRNARACRIQVLFHLGELDLCPHRFP